MVTGLELATNQYANQLGFRVSHELSSSPSSPNKSRIGLGGSPGAGFSSAINPAFPFNPVPFVAPDLLDCGGGGGKLVSLLWLVFLRIVLIAIAGGAAVFLLGGGGNAEVLPVVGGDFWKEGWDSLGLVESGGEVRCTGFRPTGGPDFFDVVLVDDIEARRSLGEVTPCDGWFDGGRDVSWREERDKLLDSDDTEVRLNGAGSFREPLDVRRGFGGGGGNDGVL